MHTHWLFYSGYLLYGASAMAIDLSGATEPRKVSSFHLLNIFWCSLTLRFVTHLPICLIVFFTWCFCLTNSIQPILHSHHSNEIKFSFHDFSLEYIIYFLFCEFSYQNAWRDKPFAQSSRKSEILTKSKRVLHFHSLDETSVSLFIFINSSIFKYFY